MSLFCERENQIKSAQTAFNKQQTQTTIRTLTGEKAKLSFSFRKHLHFKLHSVRVYIRGKQTNKSPWLRSTVSVLFSSHPKMLGKSKMTWSWNHFYRPSIYMRWSDMWHIWNRNQANIKRKITQNYWTMEYFAISFTYSFQTLSYCITPFKFNYLKVLHIIHSFESREQILLKFYIWV